jgi:tRNA threonylcarbamoyladenosine biosynthesis protein TsaE
MTLNLRTASADETRALARAMAPLCLPGDVLLLVGDLGAGKTTFAQGFAAGLGVTEQVTSPTFTLVRHYAVEAAHDAVEAAHDAVEAARDAVEAAHDAVEGATGEQEGRPPVRTLLHADVYRLDRLHEIVDLGLAELVEDGGVALVEWGDAAEPVLGDESLAIALAAEDDHDDHRLISVRPTGTAWASRWSSLQAELAPWLVVG